MAVKMKCFCLDENQASISRRTYEFTKEGVEYFFEDDIEDGVIVKTGENKISDEIPILVESLKRRRHPNYSYIEPHTKMIKAVRIEINDEELDLDNPVIDLVDILSYKEEPIETIEAEEIVEEDLEKPDEDAIDEYKKKLDGLLKDELKDILELNDLDSSGLKDELINRIVEAGIEVEFEEEENEEEEDE